MYFGALSIGADLCIGTLALHHIKASGKKIDLIFKDFKIDFLKRALADVHFICEEGSKVKDIVDEAAATGTRQTLAIKGYATTPKISGGEVIANFELTLSVK